MKIKIDMQDARPLTVAICQAVVAKPTSGLTLDAKTIYSFGAWFSARFNALLEPNTQAGRKVRTLKRRAGLSFVNRPLRPSGTSEEFASGAHACQPASIHCT